MITEYSKTEIDFLTRIGFGAFLHLSYCREVVFQKAILHAFVENVQNRDTETLRLIAEKMIENKFTWETFANIINR